MGDLSKVCFRFEPQKWRKTKCKNCFEDKNSHFNEIEAENENISLSALINESNDDQQTNGQPVDEVQNVPKKDTLEQDVSAEIGNSRALYIDEGLELRKDVVTSSDVAEFSCKPSFENGALTRFSAVEYSSCSSLASYDPLEDATLSSYSYSGSRENLDGYISCEELSFTETSMDNNKFELKDLTTAQLISSLQEEIENLKEIKKSIEVSKDKQIQELDRELQSSKLELTKYSARENMSMLKNRLELEGKNLRIEELENEVNHFQTTIDGLKQSQFSGEFQQDALEENLKRRDNRIQNLEDEKRTLEERLSLAEDLQQNDRELLDVLRTQLTSLEKDLLTTEDRNKVLEEKVKSLSVIDDQLKEEILNIQKLNKQVDFLSGKLKLREQHVSYLEDDNVSLNQQNKDLESKLKKSINQRENLSDTIKDLENDIDFYNKEIERLNAENSELEHGHWEAIIEQAGASVEVQNYIHDLERRVSESELKIRDLEFENEALLKESGELLDNLVESRADCDEIKSKFESLSEKYEHTVQVKNDQDKRSIAQQRKVKKLQKEKKRLHTEKMDGEAKASELRNNHSKLSVKYDDIEKGYKMIQLKLQSTEAKMTMLEGNKVYLEAKVDEFQHKHDATQRKLVALDNLISEYSSEDLKRDKTNQGVLNLDSVEIRLRDILDRVGTVAKIKEPETGAVVKSTEERQCERFDKGQQDAQMYSSTEKDKEKLGDICDYFEMNLKQLQEQNEVLENGLRDVFVLKSSLESASQVSVSNLSNDDDIIIPQTSDATETLDSCSTPSLSSDYRDNDGSLKIGLRNISTGTGSFFKSIGTDSGPENPVNSGTGGIGLATDVEVVMHDEEECTPKTCESDVTRERQGDDVEIVVLPNEIENSEIPRSYTDYDLRDLGFVNISLPVRIGEVNSPGHNEAAIWDILQPPENLVTTDCQESEKLARTIDRYTENLVRGTIADALEVYKCNEDKVISLQDEVTNNETGEDRNESEVADMESTRPVTSVRCVFEFQPVGPGSSSTYAQSVTMDGREKFAKLPRSTTKTIDQTESQSFSLANNDSTPELRQHGIATPHYSVAMSQIRQPVKDIDAVTTEENTTQQNNSRAGTSGSFRVSQESSGAITLTVPSACLQDPDSDSD
eukprot:gene12044-13287_t